MYPLPDSVGILLLKLVNVSVRLLGELPSEELERVLKSQSDAFEEEAVLEPRSVLEVVSRVQSGLHGPHAQGKVVLLGHGLYHFRFDGGFAFFARVISAGVAAVELTDRLNDSLVLVQSRQYL